MQCFSDIFTNILVKNFSLTLENVNIHYIYQLDLYKIIFTRNLRWE